MDRKFRRIGRFDNEILDHSLSGFLIQNCSPVSVDINFSSYHIRGLQMYCARFIFDIASCFNR